MGVMAQAQNEILDNDETGAQSSGRKRWFVRAMFGVAAILIAAVLAAWFAREDIAENLIGRQFETLGLPANYDIEEIGPERQVLTNIVIGDAARPDLTPDLTIERIVVNIRYNFGIPTLGLIRVEKPRLYGSYRGGTLSFGALDRIIFADTGRAPGLPPYEISLVDGRGLIDTDFGPVGIKAAGEGALDDGFTGIFAAIAPQLENGGCAASDVSLYGKITARSGKPHFSGPLRLGQLACPGSGLALSGAAMKLDAGADADFGTFTAAGQLAAGTVSASGIDSEGLAGTISGQWRGNALDGTYSLTGRSVKMGRLRAALVAMQGAIRSRDGLGRDGLAQTELTAKVDASGVQLARAADFALGKFERGARDTMAAPLLAKLRGALRRDFMKNGRLSAQVNLRQTDKGTTFVIPKAVLRGAGTANYASLSRVQISNNVGETPLFSGNMALGGGGLPSITGRMEHNLDGNTIFRLQMAKYEAQGSAITIPELVIAQRPGGALGFSGSVIASGPFAGGSVNNLVLPLSGRWSSAGGLAMWPKCTQIRFDRLALASAVFKPRQIDVCPPAGQPILLNNAKGAQIALGASSLDLAGMIADTRVEITSGAFDFAYPGALNVRKLDVVLGEGEGASSFKINNLDGALGADVAGSFTGADVQLAAVPLDMADASGHWNFKDGALLLSEGAFTLLDRQEEQRFEPMAARGATLTLTDGVIKAAATLREPTSDRAVTRADITHNLADSTGFADLKVDHLVLDEGLQPEHLTGLALGMVALADGQVNGAGRIDWDAERVTSSGKFWTQSLDFAAAFGPVKGASGTIAFTDLLNLTTAPDQRIKIASINPGVEVKDGEVSFDLIGGQKLLLTGGDWPFLGGKLALRPVEMNFGVGETRAFVFDIQGVDAAQFITQMELSNLSAAGTFDGTIPLIFDETGNGRIDGGMLIARAPGGNLSYVGELTYEDLTPMANFAFQTLRSLDYKKMSVEMNGPLAGELVTRVQFDGVNQGMGTEQNFITRRIAGLPIQFTVNIRAPFYQLITSLKGMYDPAFIKDPHELGLVPENRARQQADAAAKPSAELDSSVSEKMADEIMSNAEPPVQNVESEKVP